MRLRPLDKKRELCYNFVTTNNEGEKMTRLLQKHGNSVALVFDKTILEALGMTPETPLELTLSGSSLIITPAHIGIPNDELKETMQRLRPRYKTMLENLAK